MADKCPACGQDLPEEKPVVDLARTPKILEGDETPAGYLGYDGPKEASSGNEAKTATLDNQAAAKPLDPRDAGKKEEVVVRRKYERRR